MSCCRLIASVDTRDEDDDGAEGLRKPAVFAELGDAGTEAST